MSHRNRPHIVTHTPERDVEVMLAGPGSLLVMARVPTPPAERQDETDNYRCMAWPAFALDGSTAFTAEFHDLRVTVTAVPTADGKPTHEWLVTMRRDQVSENSVFRLDHGQICWQPDSRLAQVSAQMASHAESTG